MQNSPTLSFLTKLPNNMKMRCQLPDCQRAVNQIYRVDHDNYRLNFCSNDHARTGIARWDEKRKLNIKPGVPQRKDDIKTEMVSDNTDTLGGEE